MELGRRGEAAAAVDPGARVVVTGVDGEPSRLVDGALATCAEAPAAVKDALAADDKPIDWENNVFSSGRFHFLGEIVVRRARNDHSALDVEGAVAAAKARARELGGNLVAQHVRRDTGAARDLERLVMLAYRVDCAPATTAAPATTTAAPVTAP